MDKAKILAFAHLIILLMMFPSLLFAQKKEISEARANIKKGTNLEKAETSMRTLLKDSANRYNEKIWLTLFDAVKKQYDQLNEKLYLKQQSDTAKFFTHTRHMFAVLESLDSVDALPNKKGIIAPVYRKSHASYLSQYRANLLGGGAYYMKKQNYKEAYDCFDTYLECAFQPLFTDYFYSAKDERLAEAAYWAVFCGYKMNNVEIMDKYTNLAMRDKSREVYMLQYTAEAYQMKGDTANYRQTLEAGFSKYPDHQYFFPHLANCYETAGRYKDVLKISEQALFINMNNTAAWVAESSAYLNLGEYENCVSASDKAISLDEQIPIVYLNAGMSYYKRAVPITQKRILKKNDKVELSALYRRALPYLEKYRKLNPDDSEAWARPLYDIYLTLNMGDEFEEMEKYVE